MGRWSALYAEKLPAPPRQALSKLPKGGSVSFGSALQGGTDVFVAQPAPPDELAAGLDAHHLAAVAWTDADIASFMARRARLLRWGWAEADAEMLAERLVERDRGADPRVSCTDCGHYRPGRCGNYRRAGLQAPDLSRRVAALLQRCGGFKPGS